MDVHPQNDWGSVRYDARYDAYWVEAGGAKQLLFFCPWCGEKLPESQRDRWYAELEAAGVDVSQSAVPEPFRSGQWRGSPPTLRPPYNGGAIEGRYNDFLDLPANDECTD